MPLLRREQAAAAVHAVDLVAIAQRGAEALAARAEQGEGQPRALDPAALTLERVQRMGAEAMRRAREDRS